MCRVLCCALLFLPAWVFCPGTITLARAGPPVVVSGVVRWSEARDPAAGIIVAIYPPGGPRGVQPLTTRSMANGSFILKVPSAGEYRIASCTDLPISIAYHTLIVPASGVGGITLLISERFRPKGAPSRMSVHTMRDPPIQLEVTDAAGQPVRRGMVQVWFVQAVYTPQPLSTPDDRTSSEGCWIPFDASHEKLILRSQLLLEEPYRTRVGITVRSAIYGGAQVMLDRWPDAPVKIRLHPTPDLTGTVMDVNGDAVRGANVLVTGIAPELPFRFLQGWAWATTGETGHFHIPTLFPGRYGVQVCMPPGDPGPVHYVTIPGAELRTVPDAGEGAISTNALAHKPHGATIALRPPTQTFQLFPPLFAFGINEAQPIPNMELSQMPWLSGGPREYGVGLGDETLETPPADTPTKIEGHLKLATTGAPISNCMVQLFQGIQQDMQYSNRGDHYPLDVATTAPDGSFTLTALRPGSYRLQVDEYKYLPRDHPIDIIQSRAVPVSLIVAPTPVAEILVVGADGKPLVGKPLRVWIVSTHNSSDANVSLANGKPLQLRWRAPTMPLPGEGVTIGARSATVGVGLVQMDQWPTQPVTVRLTPGATLHCHVLDTAGKPNNQATVAIQGRFASATNLPQPWFITPNSGTTDHNGDVEFRNLPPAGYELLIQDYPTAVFTRRVIVTGPETSVTLKPDPTTVTIHH